MMQILPSTSDALRLVVATVAALSFACGQYRHGCLGGPCRSYIHVRVKLVGALPNVAKASVHVRGVLIKRQRRPPRLDTNGLPDPKGKHPYTVTELVELDYQRDTHIYQKDYRWDLLSDDKTWLYAFVDLNGNDHLDPGEPFGVLDGAPTTVTSCKTTVVSITVNLSRRWKGKKRW